MAVSLQKLRFASEDMVLSARLPVAVMYQYDPHDGA